VGVVTRVVAPPQLATEAYAALRPRPKASSPAGRLKIILHPERYDRTDAGERVAHQPEQGAVTQPYEFAGIDRFQQLAHLGAGQHRRLATCDHELGAAHRAGRSGHQDAACHKIIEQLANRGQVLFDARLAIPEPSSSIYAATAMGLMSSSLRWCSSHQLKKRFTARVRHPGIAIADGRGKEFDKAAAGTLCSITAEGPWKGSLAYSVSDDRAVDLNQPDAHHVIHNFSDCVWDDQLHGSMPV
jgi:hypothetical protein